MLCFLALSVLHDLCNATDKRTTRGLGLNHYHGTISYQRGDNKGIMSFDFATTNLNSHFVRYIEREYFTNEYDTVILIGCFRTDD